jgi:hypothetical protein
MTILDNGKPDRKLGLQPQRDDPNVFGIELTAAERAAIREKAKLQIRNELKDKAEAALLAEFLDEERSRVDPTQVLLPIYLELAGHESHLLVDGFMYHHQHLYHVTPTVFATLAEMMARGWAHEEETEVRDTQTRRRHRAPGHVGVNNFTDHRQPRDLRVSSGQLQGASAGALLGIGT